MNDAPRGSHLQQEPPAERHTERRRRRRRKNSKALYYGVLVLLLAVLVFSAVKIISYVKDQKDAENTQNSISDDFTRPDTDTDAADGTGDTTSSDTTTETKTDPDPESIIVDFDKMVAKYPDVVGYVYSANTVLKYPIVQTSAAGDTGNVGEYYLYRDIDGNSNKNGTVFLDYKCSSDFTSQNNIIYGHNMKTGLMFASLMNYKAQSYYEAHPYFYLYTPSQTYKVNLFAGCIVTHDADVYSTSLSSSYLQECINNSTFKSSYGVPTGNILTLSTCDYDFDNARYVVMGELVPVTNPAES